MGRPSLLATDMYKMVMAQAGYPLRQETSAFALRKGGPWIMPVDSEAFVQRLVADVRRDLAASRGLLPGMHAAYWEALQGQVEVLGVPKGAWFGDRVPALSVTGPSALVSNIEARLIGELQFRVQVATLAKLDPNSLPQRIGVVTCEQERAIVLETLAAVGVRAPEVVVDSAGYHAHISGRAAGLLAVVGDPGRVLEAGYRAASCLEQHAIALRAVKEAGFTATSNVLLAHELDMRPSGTTGHEHTQRWGSDYAAFTAIRDMVPGDVTYLLDTYSTRHCGLPTALRVMQERPSRACSVRFDSESTMEGDVLLAASFFREHGLTPGMNLGGGFNLAKTERFEEIRSWLGHAPERWRYMYGQYLVEPHVPLPTRGDVGAVYKLAQTSARPTMKFSDNPAKSSSPGSPVVFQLRHPDGSDFTRDPLCIIGQRGEKPPDHYFVLSGATEDELPLNGSPKKLARRYRTHAAVNSKATQALVDRLTDDKADHIRRAIDRRY